MLSATPPPSQRASEPAEKARILAAGGSVSDGRVWGHLMPSRTLGDFKCKDRGPGLIATPFIGEYEVGPADKYLILGSDGLYDILSNKQISRVVGRLDCSAQRVVNKLIEEAKKKPRDDDLTALVVQLHAPA